MKHTIRHFAKKNPNAKPKNRVKFAGSSVLTVNQVDPTDGGPLVSEGLGLYGPDGNPDPNDVNQGALADCYFLASLASLASCQNGQSWLKSIQYINAANPTQVVTKFSDALNGVTTLVYSDLLISTEFEQFDPSNRDLWVELFVKSYAYYRYGQYGGQIQGVDTYGSLNYGNPSQVFYDLGCVPIGAPGVSPDPSIFAQMKALLDGGSSGICLLTPTPTVNGSIVADHAYSVVGGDGATFITIRNPWGIDSGGPTIDIGLSDFNSGNFDEIEFATIPSVAIVTPVPTMYSQAQLDAAVAAGVSALAAKALPLAQTIASDIHGIGQ